MHLFVNCERVQCIWKNIEAKIRGSLNCVITLNERSILFGLDLDGSFGIEIKNAIQRLLLMGKYYIYRMKAAERRLDITDWEYFCSFYTRAEFKSLIGKESELTNKQYRAHKMLCM